VNRATESETVQAVLALLLDAEPDAHEAYHHDAEFRAHLVAKATLLVSELESMTLAAQVRRIGMAAAAQALSTKVLTFTQPPGKQP
jgi:hypothetical protein